MRSSGPIRRASPCLFIAYQLYRYSWTDDVGLILLPIFDPFVIYLAVHEYGLLRKHLPTH